MPPGGNSDPFPVTWQENDKEWEVRDDNTGAVTYHWIEYVMFRNFVLLPMATLRAILGDDVLRNR